MTLSSAPYDPHAGQGSLAANTTSKLALWAMVLGILGLLTGCLGVGLLLGITALILGLVALGQIGKPGMPGQGKGMAITGVVTGGLSLILVPIMLVAILLPALGAARTTARQMVSITQGRAIQQAMVTYAASQSGAPYGPQTLTEDIGALVEQNYFTAEFTQSPMDEIDGDLPGNFDAMPRDAQIDWVRRHADYVIVPGLTDDPDAAVIAVFGKPGRFTGGIPVTYNDNSTEWVPEFDLTFVQERLQQQTGKSMDQLIREAEAFTATP